MVAGDLFLEGVSTLSRAAVKLSATSPTSAAIAAGLTYLAVRRTAPTPSPA